MANDMDFQICPETGIGCLMIQNGEDTIKVDLMPDETDNLRAMVVTNNLKGAKQILAELNSEAEEALDEESLKVLAKELR
jgi:hypothetical protein